MTQHLFTYGTLELSEVFEAITGKPANGIPATAENYGRYLLQGESYPGIIAVDGVVTHGTLYLDLDAESLQKIDHYEDTCYEKHQLRVITADQQEFEAMAYVIPSAKSQLLSDRSWDQQYFIKEHLQSFLRYIR